MTGYAEPSDTPEPIEPERPNLSIHSIQWPARLRRRTLLTTVLALGVTTVRAETSAVVRLGTLPFGSVQWVADIIKRHGLDRANGFELQTLRLATTEALKVALLGGSVDVAVSDWPFVVIQRRHAGHLCFAAGNNGGLGAIMVAGGSPVRRLADLKGRRLGVAGGPADKSWLLVQAAASRQGIDLARQATLSYGAPPLLDAMLRDGELDALLTFWTSAAKLQASGFREALSVAQCAEALGLTEPPVLVGYVFDDRWAAANRRSINGFLKASRAAAALLSGSPGEWNSIRPLTGASSDAEFDDLRSRFIAGMRRPAAAVMEREATRIEDLLAGDGTQAAPAVMPAGVFWRGADAG